MRPVKVMQSEEKTMPVEVIAEHVKAISQGITKLRQGPLNDKALTLLIQHAAPCDSRGTRINLTTIRDVLDGIESLEKTYLKKRTGQ